MADSDKKDPEIKEEPKKEEPKKEELRREESDEPKRRVRVVREDDSDILGEATEAIRKIRKLVEGKNEPKRGSWFLDWLPTFLAASIVIGGGAYAFWAWWRNRNAESE